MVRPICIFIGSLIIGVVGATLAVPGSASKSCDKGGKITFGDWRTWTKVTPKPGISRGHSDNWVGVYVNELARNTYMAGGAPYQECAKIVKPIYADANGSRTIKLTIMVKMPTSYDPENADWWYGVYDASGKEVRREGKLLGCIACHKEASQTDYLFSREVVGRPNPKLQNRPLPTFPTLRLWVFEGARTRF